MSLGFAGSCGFAGGGRSVTWVGGERRWSWSAEVDGRGMGGFALSRAVAESRAKRALDELKARPPSARHVHITISADAGPLLRELTKAQRGLDKLAERMESSGR